MSVHPDLTQNEIWNPQKIGLSAKRDKSFAIVEE